jgi:hypothetical protein
VKAKGGLKAIVVSSLKIPLSTNGSSKNPKISHPHFYNTHLEWAAAFSCPVYLSSEDSIWLCRPDSPTHPRRTFISTQTQTILPSVTAIKVGGHFPGSLVLHWDRKLFLADSIMTVPSGIYHKDRPAGTASYSFMWSYPNMIPLSPDAVWGIWKAVKGFEFWSTYGGFPGQDIRGEGDLRRRVLQSMQIWVSRLGLLGEGEGVLGESF